MSTSNSSSSSGREDWRRTGGLVGALPSSHGREINRSSAPPAGRYAFKPQIQTFKGKFKVLWPVPEFQNVFKNLTRNLEILD